MLSFREINFSDKRGKMLINISKIQKNLFTAYFPKSQSDHKSSLNALLMVLIFSFCDYPFLDMNFLTFDEFYI